MDVITMLWEDTLLDPGSQTNSGKDEKMSRSVTLNGLPPGCTSFHRLQSDST